jgi:hypothetical protein
LEIETMAKSSAARKSPGASRKRQPEKKIGPFNAGIGVCVWLNTIETESGPRTVRSITINPRRYFDREANEWKDAGSYNPADLPALIFALQKAQEYSYEKPLPGQAGGEVESTSGPTPAGEIPF